MLFDFRTLTSATWSYGNIPKFWIKCTATAQFKENYSRTVYYVAWPKSMVVKPKFYYVDLPRHLRDVCHADMSRESRRLITGSVMSRGRFGVLNHYNMSRWFGEIQWPVADKPVCVALWNLETSTTRSNKKQKSRRRREHMNVMTLELKQN